MIETHMHSLKSYVMAGWWHTNYQLLLQPSHLRNVRHVEHSMGCLSLGTHGRCRELWSKLGLQLSRSDI